MLIILYFTKTNVDFSKIERPLYSRPKLGEICWRIIRPSSDKFQSLALILRFEIETSPKRWEWIIYTCILGINLCLCEKAIWLSPLSKAGSTVHQTNLLNMRNMSTSCDWKLDHHFSHWLWNENKHAQIDTLEVTHPEPTLSSVSEESSDSLNVSLSSLSHIWYISPWNFREENTKEKRI